MSRLSLAGDSRFACMGTGHNAGPGRVMAGVMAAAMVLAFGACSDGDWPNGVPNTDPVEICDNGLDDDSNGTADCADAACEASSACVPVAEICTDAHDNDLDGDVDCTDSDCAASPSCSENCTNGSDDDGNSLIDCDDPQCAGIDPSCGEVCSDGRDNDGDNVIDCMDSDCFGVIPPCGADGTTCNYDGTTPHPCACADGEDNDGDGRVDGDDLHCFGPFDDDELSYSTGIPGDNNGSKGNRECPFDGNSGPGNDAICCNPADPTQNVTPNGCDSVGCCEIDLNDNGTGEHVYVSGTCTYGATCGNDGTIGCACAGDGECSAGEFCIFDDDTGDGFCSLCEPCVADAACANSCDCGESCFGGFTQPAADCGGDDGGGGGGGGGTCPDTSTACPGGDTECDATANERCSNGCCFAVCPQGVIPCSISSDCPTDRFYYCITGCCIESA